MRQEIRITVTGLTPLVLKRSFWERVSDNATDTPNAPQLEHSLEDEIYRDEQGCLVFPSHMMVNVLNHQAAQSGLLPKRSGATDFTIGNEWILLLDPVTQGEAEVQPYSQPSDDFTAAQTERWRAKFTLEHESTMPVESVKQVVTEAGRNIGIGAATRSTPPCGRFQITDWEEVI